MARLNLLNVKKEPYRYNFCQCGGIKKKQSEVCFNCKYDKLRGDKHPSWKGGKKASKERLKIYNKTANRKAQLKRYQQSEKGKKKAKELKRKCAELKLNFILNLKAQIGCQELNCEIDHPHLIEFHHPNGREEGEKRTSGYLSWLEIFNLCKKCILLCANHHKLTHIENINLKRRVN